jgi:hypothetical protein
VTLSGGAIEECGEPNLADRLSAEGFSHLLLRRSAADESEFETRRSRAGLRQAAHFAEADVFAVTAPTPAVYTAATSGFHPREYDAAWSWRWMGAAASWRLVNTRDRAVVAFVDVEITAFHHARTLILRLDGREVHTLVVGTDRMTHRLGPFAITPGAHDLAFHAEQPPAVAADLIGNSDPRALSFAVGAWNWVIP